MTEKIRVAIVDIYPIFREGVVQALRRDNRCLVVGEGATLEDAERAAGNQLDVLLIEAAVPKSLQTAKSILEKRKCVKVVFLASVEDEVHATQALRDGAHGYLMKGVSAAELVGAARVVPFHYGIFGLLSGTHQALRSLLPDGVELLVPEPGETLTL